MFARLASLRDEPLSHWQGLVGVGFELLVQTMKMLTKVGFKALQGLPIDASCSLVALDLLPSQ